MAPARVDRNIPARLNDSFHASDRDARRLQCSVERIWRRIAGEIGSPSVDAPPLPAGTGGGSAPGPLGRSNIGPLLRWSDAEDTDQWTVEGDAPGGAAEECGAGAGSADPLNVSPPSALTSIVTV